MKKSEWKKNCSECGRDQYYTVERSLQLAIENDIYCKSCSHKGNKLSEEHKRKISRASFGRRHSEETKKKISLSNKGKNNAFYGKKHTEKSKQKMRENRLDTSGENNPMYGVHRFGRDNPFYGKKHTKESRNIMSTTRSQLISEGKINITKNSRGYKGWYFSTKNNEKFYHDSALELYRMMQLDNCDDINWWTKRHGIRIPYIRDNNQKNYVPDFLIQYKNGNKVLEEIKGYDPYANIKRNALLKYCSENKLIFRWINQEEVEGYRQWMKKYLSPEVVDL